MDRGLPQDEYVRQAGLAEAATLLLHDVVQFGDVDAAERGDARAVPEPLVPTQLRDAEVDERQLCMHFALEPIGRRGAHLRLQLRRTAIADQVRGEEVRRLDRAGRKTARTATAARSTSRRQWRRTPRITTSPPVMLEADESEIAEESAAGARARG